MILRLFSVLSIAAAFAMPAAASVLSEADGQFSRHWMRPTEVAAGIDTILGTAEKQNAHEFLLLTGLRPGAQTLNFSFQAPDWALDTYSFSAGGLVMWTTNPFKHAWDGIGLDAFQLSPWAPEAPVELVLGDDFEGPLYLGIYLTHGRDVTWSISTSPADAWAKAPEASPVPLSAAAGYGLAGCAMLAAFGIRDSSRRSA